MVQWSITLTKTKETNMSEQMMAKPQVNTKVKVISSILNQEQVTALVADIYVGYNPNATLENARFKASKRMMSQLNLNLSKATVDEMMNDKNVPDCGGLDNYFYVLYTRLSEINSKKVA